VFNLQSRIKDVQRIAAPHANHTHTHTKTKNKITREISFPLGKDFVLSWQAADDVMMTMRIITNSVVFSELIEHRGGVACIRRILSNRKSDPDLSFLGGLMALM
jgi:hypothetical protein